MSVKSEKAEILFRGGLNCAQAVLGAFCEDYGLTVGKALQISAGLGGGLRKGEVCGAVSGAVIVLGLKYGPKTPEDLDSKQLCNKKTIEFMDAFREKNGAVTCRELLERDTSKEKGTELTMQPNQKKEICVNLVKSAAELLESMDC